MAGDLLITWRPKFANEIEMSLLASLDSTNALQVLQEAHGLHKLKDICEKKVAEDFEACSQHPEFGKLSSGQLARILEWDCILLHR